MKNKGKINEKFILDSAIINLQICFNKYKKVLIKNIDSWSVNDKGECVFLGDYELMYAKELKLKNEYDEASILVNKLKGEYSEVKE